MQECDVEVLMPSLSHIPEPSLSSPPRFDDIALAAAESGPREVTDVYVGETAFLLLIVRGAESAHLRRTVDALEHVTVSTQTLSADEPDSPPAGTASPSVVHQLPSPTAASLPLPSSSVSQSPGSAAFPSSTGGSPAVLSTGIASSPPSAGSAALGGSVPPIPPLGLSASATSGNSPSSPAVSLPILHESGWVSVPDQPRNGEPSSEGASRLDGGGGPGDVSGGGGSGSTSSHGAGVATSPPRKVICKGLWVLFRAPPESSSFYDVMALTGQQQLSVVLRERSVVGHADSSRSCAGEAVSLASRQAGFPNALTGSRVVGVHVPLDLSFRHVRAGGDDSNAFVSITARNTTSDAVISVVPPYVHLASSVIVEVDGEDSTSARTSAKRDGSARSAKSISKGKGTLDMLSEVSVSKGSFPGHARSDAVDAFRSWDSREGHDARVPLEDYFVFQRECCGYSEPLNGGHESLSDPEDGSIDQDGSDEMNSIRSDDNHLEGSDFARNVHNGQVAANEKNCPVNNDNVAKAAGDVGEQDHVGEDDYGVFIPSFGRRLKEAVSIGPREVFDFVFAIAPKVSGGGGSTSKSAVPRLGFNQCIETPVSVAWSCRPRGSTDSDRAIATGKGLRREMSSGGVLATGRRSNAALRLLSIQWSPPSLVEDIVMSFSGPSVTGVRSCISVSVTILNQTRQRLNEASLFLDTNGWDGGFGTEQQPFSSPLDKDIRTGEPPTSLSPSAALEREGQLLPLRTVISIGAIEAGSIATVRVSCLALGRGCASLERVAVADGAPPPGSVPRLWRAKSAFKTFVVDSDCANTHVSPTHLPLSENRTTMITENLSVIEL